VTKPAAGVEQCQVKSRKWTFPKKVFREIDHSTLNST
jgi:hypothetical protein